jgi:dihydropteroate synthase
MGIVNVTPDSFFAAARTEDIDAAIARGSELFDLGATIVDVGGESSRPGASSVDESVEIARVIPVIEALAGHGRVSVDTVKPAVARAAVEAGATLINDVSGTLAPIAAEAGVAWVAMHAQGTPQTMQESPSYGDVVAEVSSWLAQKAEEARALGIAELWLDPGIGFGKTQDHNWSLLRHTDQLAALCAEHGAKLLVGTSRKRFLGGAEGSEIEVDDRLAGSLATAIVAMEGGADMVRVHDVLATVQAARLMTEEMVG